MTLPTRALLECAIVGGALACALASLIFAAWTRAQARADRLALRLAREREVAFVEAARRLADAAGTSILAVREEIDRAVRAIAPAIEVVLVFEERGAQLTCVGASGERTTHYAGMNLALDDTESLVVCALTRGHRVTLRDVPQARSLHPGDVSAAAVPLVLDAGRKCVLYVGSSAVVGTESIDRIVRLVDQATPAYRIALERAEDRARAEFDGLTGLLTARAFRARLADLLEASRFRPLGRVSLLFVDTDKFKAWNDTFGHASGDALLRNLAQLLRDAATGDGDIVARNGGDEFCIVLGDAEKSEAVERAEALCVRIANRDFSELQPAGIATNVRISASIGVACFPVDAPTPSVLLQMADEAMYHSKKSGRNAVSYFGVDGALTLARSGAALALGE